MMRPAGRLHCMRRQPNCSAKHELSLLGYITSPRNATNLNFWNLAFFFLHASLFLKPKLFFADRLIHRGLAWTGRHLVKGEYYEYNECWQRNLLSTSFASQHSIYPNLYTARIEFGWMIHIAPTLSPTRAYRGRIAFQRHPSVKDIFKKALGANRNTRKYFFGSYVPL